MDPKTVYPLTHFPMFYQLYLVLITVFPRNNTNHSSTNPFSKTPSFTTPKPFHAYMQKKKKKHTHRHQHAVQVLT